MEIELVDYKDLRGRKAMVYNQLTRQMHLGITVGLVFITWGWIFEHGALITLFRILGYFCILAGFYRGFGLLKVLQP